MSKCKCDSDNDDSNFSPKEMFEIALKARDFEIKMFWQRCNYFLLLNTSVGAAVGAAVVSGEASPFIIFCLCIIGMFVCLAWINVGLGAKFWQVYWEQVVNGLQKKVGLLEKNSSEKNNIFGKDNITRRVEEGLGEKKKQTKIPSFLIEMTPLFPFSYEQRVLNKPSVSRWMHKTAFFFFLVWVFASAYTFSSVPWRILFCRLFN